MHRMNAIELARLVQVTWDEGRYTPRDSWHNQSVYESDLFPDVWFSCVMGWGFVEARNEHELRRRIDWAVFQRDQLDWDGFKEAAA